ncbi:MAG: cation:proton antiporter [Patescibacteria group bacterium]
MNPRFFVYLRLFAALAVVVLASTVAPTIFGLFLHGPEHAMTISFFSTGLIFAFSFIIFYLSRGTHLPPFVVAIFFGMAAKPLFAPVIHDQELMGAIVGFGATLILFGGGLETVFGNFRKMLPKILFISFFGLLVTATLLSLFVHATGPLFGSTISVAAAILLGSILASTDPAAIIPVLKRLRFKQPETKDLIISESAVTDVTGTLLTVAFLSLLVGGAVLGPTILGGYSHIFSIETGLFLLKQLLFGVLFGVLGFALLAVLTRFKASHEGENEVDAAFFLFIPIMIFAFAIAFGGSGYLAAFIAGLLFVMSEHLQETEHFFNHIIDGFFKPTIFLLLGALIDIPALIQYAPIGIAAALVFIFVIRPIAVFISLGAFTFIGKDRLNLSQLLFISCVRETGAIPAVLLVTTVSLGITGIEGLLPIGMWVILATLILEPPLTPWIAQKLGVAEVIPEDQPELEKDHFSFVVLGTRGNTYKERIPLVAQWASNHQIPKVLLLLCLEYKYQPELEQRVQSEAERIFKKLNEDFIAQGKKPLLFSISSSAGFLQENIDYLAKHEKNLVAIFVGRKMLDYRLDEVKKLEVPIQFMS